MCVRVLMNECVWSRHECCINSKGLCVALTLLTGKGCVLC